MMKSIALVFVVLIYTVNGKSIDINLSTKELATASNEFALKLYDLLTRDNSNNVFYSPLSIHTAFTVLLNGASGNTEKELREALGYGQSNTKFEQTMEAYRNV